MRVSVEVRLKEEVKVFLILLIMKENLGDGGKNHHPLQIESLVWSW